MSFYEILDKLMAERGIKPIDISRATGISTSSLSDWKAGRSSPKLDKIKILSDFFNVPIDTFMNQSRPTTEHSKKDLVDLNEFLKNTEIMFDGEVHEMNEQDRQTLRTAIEFVFWQAKERNKRKPKK